MRQPLPKNTVAKLPLYASLLFFLSFSLLSEEASAQQKQVQILNASRIVGGVYEGEQVRRILGQVHIQHDNLEMYCDSAYQFINKNEIRAFGNIEIDTGEEKIWTDSLTYYTDIDFSQLRGRVIMEADSATVFGNSVDYRFSNKVAHFIDQIRLEDMRGTLRADSGYYYRAVDSVQFKGKVQLADSLQYLEGDSLFGNRSKGYYEMHGQVFGDDRENSTMLKGEYLETDSTGRRLLETEAWLKNYESDTSDTTQADTTHIQAQTILSREQRSAADTTVITHAFGNVRIWSPDFSAISDTSRYTDSTQTFELWSNAVAWHENVQLTGPYIRAILNDGSIDSLKSYPDPFSVQQDTTINRLNQITGDTLYADFSEGTLHQIHVFQNAHLYRFTKNQQQKPDGAIELSAPSIRIIFSEGEIDSLKATGPNEGSFLPENEKTAQRQLEGFSWNPDQRPPEPEAPMKRRFPPLEDELFFDLPRRYIQHLRNTHPGHHRLPVEAGPETPLEADTLEKSIPDTSGLD
ncbi:OstA-like protein [Fodinibius sediminis]|uniref:OstA-like protein n=1 Tax=Fodinibius sediminis TaxID=1214077 RepID=A0A521D2J9_9BACT|nr:OstA-like protein [Fodinibius sediminis]SMO65251.1 OstA-like protein [Fodinibius sediminis]